MSGKFYLLFALPLLILVSCKKDEPLVIDPVPHIELISASPLTVKQFHQGITVKFSYDDQDGDLGFSDPDSMSVAVTDSRLENPDYYFLQPLAPPDQVIHIRGALQLNLNSPFLLGSGSTEVMHYSIIIRDRAGNWSNEIQTPDITITQ